MITTHIKNVMNFITSTDDAIKNIMMYGGICWVGDKKALIVKNCFFKGVSFAVVSEALTINEIYFKDCVFIECELMQTDMTTYTDNSLCIYIDTDIINWIPKGLDIYENILKKTEGEDCVYNGCVYELTVFDNAGLYHSIRLTNEYEHCVFNLVNHFDSEYKRGGKNE